MQYYICMQEGYPLSPRQYDDYVAEHGHMPTQDPIYNHKAGSPANRVSTAQEDQLVGNRSNPAADVIEAGTATQAEIDSMLA
jgi:hypothetical protein